MLVGSASGHRVNISVGDYVVHIKYGIGRYDGLVPFVPPRSKSSYTDNLYLHRPPPPPPPPTSSPSVPLLTLSYADGIVYVPQTNSHRLSRYRSGQSDVTPPRLSTLAGGTWRDLKSSVSASTASVAASFLALYARRALQSRPPSSPSSESDVSRFASTFPYIPTSDQVLAFAAVEHDMVWRRRPMDRLVCGDVGFGKTEVALRAVYRAVANGRQAAILAPTTVLANQHHKTLMSRMGPGTGFEVSMALVRGHDKGVKEAWRKVKAGEIQLVVGTHAVLGKNAAYKDLGLLVIDEEQRFGVEQKERLKRLCVGIDVLSLSATPIPRTLQMSLAGIRDTTTIRTPPPNRRSVDTVVAAHDEGLVAAAVRRELARGGQCFYVVPKIAMIDRAVKALQRAVPEARVVVAHGGLRAGLADSIISAFSEGSGDVLIATTLIENGIDIPKVNTIVIENAQSFGLSALYQLRGRVGRSSEPAYALLLYPKEGEYYDEYVLTPAALQRLKAVEDMSALGSGFDIAQRDLEIRGAGTMFGMEQSGTAMKVGHDLYLRMLKRAINKLRAGTIPTISRTSVNLGGSGGEGCLEVSAADRFSLSEDYIADPQERARAEGEGRLADSSERLKELTAQWKSTYGKIPEITQARIKTLHFHCCCRNLGIDDVSIDEKTGNCILRSKGLRPRHAELISEKLGEQGKTLKGAAFYFPPKIVQICEREFAFEEEDDYFEDCDDYIVEAEKAQAQLLGARHVELDLRAPDVVGPGAGGELGVVVDDDDALNNIGGGGDKESSWESFPALIVHNLLRTPEGKRVDELLKYLMPMANITVSMAKQESDKYIQEEATKEQRAIAEARSDALRNQA